MSKQEKEIAAVVDAPNISLSEDEKAGEAILKFYEALGWNRETEIVDPCKVRTTKSVYSRLYDVTYEKCPEPVAVGMTMVNIGPGVDAGIPEGKVYLLKDWITADKKQEEETPNGGFSLKGKISTMNSKKGRKLQ